MTRGQGAVARGAIQKASELDALVPIVEAVEPELIIEIGVYLGGTAWLWAQLARTVVAIDVAPLVFRRLPPNVTLVKGNSQDIGLRARIAAGPPIDVLFIDGDHTYRAAQADVISYWPLVRPGGLVVLHDIAEHEDPDVGVPALWHDLAHQLPGHARTEIIHEPRNWGGLGIIHKAAQPR